MSGRQVIERVWDAPIDLIWELWTTPEAVQSWYGPNGFDATVHEMHLEVGGRYKYTMSAATPEMAANMEKSGKPSSWTVEATFTAVDPPHRLAWDSPWGNDKLMTSVTFTEVEGGVKMELVIDATKPEMTTGAAMGWKSTVERFAGVLAARQG